MINCANYRNGFHRYVDVIINTCYMGNVPLKLKKGSNGYILESKHGSIFIKVIDITQHGLNYEVVYPIHYLLGLESISTDITEKNFCHDIIFNVYNYLSFLDKHDIEFKYDNLIILANIPNFDNAFWNGSYLSFGAGDKYNPLTCPMIVGHELSHALIQQICDLEYHGHSGALNESYADIFGVAFEEYVHETHKSLGFELGSETGFLIRDMRDPHRKWQPKVMYDQYYCDPSSVEDNGGVHINSGIINHIFVLISDVISIKNAFRLFYYVLIKLHKFSKFNSFKNTLIFVNAYHKYIGQDLLVKILDEHIS